MGRGKGLIAPISRLSMRCGRCLRVCVTAGLDRASRNAADVEVMFPYDVSEPYSSYLKTFSHEPSGIDLCLKSTKGVLVQSVLIAVHLDGSLSCVKCQKSRAYPS